MESVMSCFLVDPTITITIYFVSYWHFVSTWIRFSDDHCLFVQYNSINQTPFSLTPIIINIYIALFFKVTLFFWGGGLKYNTDIFVPALG